MPAAAHGCHEIAGKWTKVDRWQRVNLVGRVPFSDVEATYRRSLATVTLVPDRFASVGQMTQRLFEAVLAGCIPLTPSVIRSAERFTPVRLHVRDGDDVLSAVRDLLRVAGSEEHAALLMACMQHLDLFRLSRQLPVLEDVLASVAAPGVRRG